MSKTEIVVAFRALLAAVELTFEEGSTVEKALYSWQDSPAGFVDCLVAARHRRLGCLATATFDAKQLRVPGFIPV